MLVVARPCQKANTQAGAPRKLMSVCWRVSCTYVHTFTCGHLKMNRRQKKWTCLGEVVLDPRHASAAAAHATRINGVWSVRSHQDCESCNSFRIRAGEYLHRSFQSFPHTMEAKILSSPPASDRPRTDYRALGLAWRRCFRLLQG